MSDALLTVRLLGPLRVEWAGTDITPAGPRGQAVLALLAVAGRPLPRAVLAERIWGPGRLRNLRQELYNLRRLPGADTWLHLTRAEVGLRCTTDRAALEAGTRPPPAEWPTLLDGLSTLGTPALEDWLEAERRAWEVARLSLDEGREDRLVSLYALAAPHALPEALVSSVLGVPSEALAGLLEAVPLQHGALGGRHVRPTLTALSPELRIDLLVGALGQPDIPLAPALRDHLQEQLASPDTFEPALDRLAPADAWNTLVHALDGRPDTQRAVYARRIADLQCSGRADALTATLDLLHAHALRAQAPPLLLESTRHRFIGLLRKHELSAARELSDDMLRLADRHGTPDERGHARMCRGELHRLSGEPTEAARWFSDARLVPGASGRTTVVALNGAGAIAAMQGRLHEALRLHEEALAQAREAGLRAEVPRLLNSVGSDAVRLGRHRRAARAYREAATVALMDGNRAVWATVLRNAALSGIRGGRFGDARQDLHALEGATGALLPIHALLVLDVRADFLRALGHVGDAEENLRQLREQADALGDTARVRLADVNLAALALQRGDASALEAWTVGIQAVLADGDYVLAENCLADVLVWGAVRSGVRRARALLPTDVATNPRHSLARALGALRLDPARDPTSLTRLLDDLPPTPEAARGWLVLWHLDHPGAEEGLDDCLTALTVGLSADDARVLRRHYTDLTGLMVR